MIKVATVCSGIGSPEVAINELNIEHEIVFACDIDKYARASYLSNFTPGEMYTDMTKENWEGEKYKSDLFIGGIPCQAFSLAGKRLGELDKRGLLFYDFYRYVQNQQPKVFIIENVKGLLSDAGGKTFQNWLLLLGDSVNGHHQMFNHPDSLGYNLHWTVLNSKDFGVPQNRERVFIVGVRNDLPNDFRFPAATRLTLRLKDILEDFVDEKYYLTEDIIKTFTNHLNRNIEKGFGFGWNPTDGNVIANTLLTHASQLQPGSNFIIEKNSVLVSKERRTEDAKKQRRETGSNYFRGKQITFEPSEVMNCLQTGLTNDHLIIQPILVKEATAKGYAEASEGDSINLSNTNSETRRGRVGVGMANTLDTACNQAVVVNEPSILQTNMSGQTFENDYAGTLRAGASANYQVVKQVNSRIRKLTPLECWRLQGFPDANFYKAQAVPTSDSQLYKQAGNSMTTKVMKAIIKNLLPILEA